MLDAAHRRGPVGRAADGLDDGLRELGRQRGLEHDHRNARRQVFARHLQPVGGVGIDDGVETLERVEDRREPIGVRAAAGNESVATDAREFGGCQPERTVAIHLALEQLAGALRVTAQQVEHEALKVRRLRDVHRRA